MKWTLEGLNKPMGVSTYTDNLMRMVEKHLDALQVVTDKTEPTDEPVREPTNEASAETKLVWAMPCKEEEDDSQ